MTEWKPFWQPNGTVSIQSAKVAEAVDQAPAVLPGACKFAVGLIFAGSENRTCVSGVFCEAAVFKDPKVYMNCDIRKKKLAAEKI